MKSPNLSTFRLCTMYRVGQRHTSWGSEPLPINGNHPPSYLADAYGSHSNEMPQQEAEVYGT